MPTSGVIGAVRARFKKAYLANEDETTMRSVMDLQGFVHPAYEEPAELLEFCLRKLAAGTELVLHRWSGVS